MDMKERGRYRHSDTTRKDVRGKWQDNMQGPIWKYINRNLEMV